MKSFIFALCLPALALPARASLKVAGSRVLGPVAINAAKVLLEEKGLEIVVSADVGTDGGVAALAEHQVQVALCSRYPTGEERALAPDVVFNEIPIGRQAIALVVSRDVWQGGVHAISRAQMRDLYEGRVTNWKQLGGPDLKIHFFNREERRGAWEVFAKWLYGETRKAVGVSFDVVNTDEEAKEAVGSGAGAISQLALPLADRKSVFALSIRDDDGKIIEPTLAAIAEKKYPMTSPLLLIVDNLPTGAVKVFVDFLIGPQGREIMRKQGYIPIADIEKAKP